MNIALPTATYTINVNSRPNLYNSLQGQKSYQPYALARPGAKSLAACVALCRSCWLSSGTIIMAARVPQPRHTL